MASPRGVEPLTLGSGGREEEDENRRERDVVSHDSHRIGLISGLIRW